MPDGGNPSEEINEGAIKDAIESLQRANVPSDLEVARELRDTLSSEEQRRRSILRMIETMQNLGPMTGPPVRYAEAMGARMRVPDIFGESEKPRPAVVVSEAQKEIEALTLELSKDQAFEQKSYPVVSNWASQLGHTCERYLYHNRHDWEQKKPKDWKGMGERGNLIHEWWKRRMSEKGYTVIQTEMPLSQALRNRFQIGGKIDGRIGKNGKPKLYEFKTMNEHDYKKINTLEDIRNSFKDYVKMYVAQIMVYMFDNNEESGLIILCNTTTLEWKPISVYLDYDYVEYLLQRADRVNRALEAQEPPKRIEYGKTCMKCDFAHVCLPDIKNEGLAMIDQDHLVSLLDRRSELESHQEEYKEIDAEAKEISKAIGKDFILAGRYKVEVKKSTTRRLDTKSVPFDVRSKYEVETETTRINFIPL